MAADQAQEIIESFSPATGARIGAVPVSAGGQVQRVVDEVAQVQPFWAQLTLADRARYLRRAGQVIVDELDDLRDLIAREQGKPRTEAYTLELLPSIDALSWIADAGPKILADEPIATPQPYLKLKRHGFAYEPLGVVGVIAPCSQPWTIPLGQVAMALIAGNGVVLKPAPLTCLIGERIARVFERAGLPEGIVRAVHGDARTGQELVRSTAAKIFFTGSVEAGRAVGEACSVQLKGSVLELGGSDPMLVLSDAPLPHAVGGALWGAFADAGQARASIRRVYVMRQVAEPFVAGVVEGARRLTVGDPLSWDTQVGPMVSADRREVVRGVVDEAVAAGAVLQCGGPVEPTGLEAGAFFAPAVLTGVTHDMRIVRDEVLGPVLSIVTVESEDEAIALANDSRFGLGASVWTRDRPHGERIARELQAGMVWINDHMYSHGACQCPWGGTKDSGLGRTHSKLGFYECVNPKLVAWEPSRVRDLWWHPYDETLGRAVRASARLLYSHRESDREPALREGAVPLLRVAGRTLRTLSRR